MSYDGIFYYEVIMQAIILNCCRKKLLYIIYFLLVFWVEVDQAIIFYSCPPPCDVLFFSYWYSDTYEYELIFVCQVKSQYLNHP